MKAFKIQSPCYRANGHEGSYFSIAITDDNGNVIKGYGDHISNNPYGIKNVYESEGQPFSDSDRFISIEEVSVSESDFDAWVEAYNNADKASEEWHKAKENKFGDTYSFLYKGTKKQQKENQEIYDAWMAENPAPKRIYCYDFLNLIHEK